MVEPQHNCLLNIKQLFSFDIVQCFELSIEYLFTIPCENEFIQMHKVLLSTERFQIHYEMHKMQMHKMQMQSKMHLCICINSLPCEKPIPFIKDNLFQF